MPKHAISQYKNNQKLSVDESENSVFVSYAWRGESEKLVDELETAFAEKGIRIIRDKKALEYKGSIEEFEKEIGRGRCIILVISDKYLRSEHCMFELVEINENLEFRKRIFPIVLGDALIFDSLGRLNYIKYWDKKIAKLNQKIKQVQTMNNLDGIMSDLDKFTRIRNNIAQLTNLLRDMNALTPEIHTTTKFSTLISAIELTLGGEQSKYKLDTASQSTNPISNTRIDSVIQTKNKRVQLILEGEISEFNLQRQQDIIGILSVMLGIEPEDLKILQVSQGSIIITMEMPETAASLLYMLATERDSRIMTLEIKSIWVDDREIIQFTNETVIDTGIQDEQLPQQNTSLTEKLIQKELTPKIGIITALPKEYIAVKMLLENCRDYTFRGKGGGRTYLLGEIPAKKGGFHLVVLALADMGNNLAGTRATQLLEHFPEVEDIMMVGIAGGVPFPDKPDEHVRLGDIVISSQKGVIQYDLDKETPTEIIHRHSPRPPSAALLDGVRLLEAAEIAGEQPWLPFINQILKNRRVKRPSAKSDILADTNDSGKIIPHPKDSKRKLGKPRVFIGAIASANKLLKNPHKRDELREKFGVKAIEMESSGVADAAWGHNVGCLVVRGICDYCDGNKGDAWQEYAAIAAAGYTRALIESLSPQIDPKSSKTQITIVLYRNTKDFTNDQRESFRFEISKIADCRQEQIQISQIYGENAHLVVQMPELSASTLIALSLSKNEELTRVGIKRISLGIETEENHQFTIKPDKENLEGSRQNQETDDLIGKYINDKRYQIVELLGKSNFSSVYKAKDMHIPDSFVAAKIINITELSGSKGREKIQAEFDRERKALAQLKYHHIARITDSGFEGELLYIIMEYYAGGTLESRLGKPMPISQAAQLLIPIAEALSFAHKRGYIHRDVKPSNILFTETGDPVLSDFGLVKSLRTEDTALTTETGVFKGTSAYAPIEQFDGNVSFQSDVYALGIIFYEMVTGQNPFKTKKLSERLTAIIGKPSLYIPDISEDVERVILQATATNLNDRYKNMDDFLVELKKLAVQMPVQSSIAFEQAGNIPFKKNTRENELENQEKTPFVKDIEQKIHALVIEGNMAIAKKLLDILETHGVEGKQAAQRLKSELSI